MVTDETELDKEPEYEYMTITILKSNFPFTLVNYQRKGWRCWTTESINPREVKLFLKRPRRK